MTGKLQTWTIAAIAGFAAITASYFAINDLLIRDLKREAHMQGMDWAHHLERQFETHAEVHEAHDGMDEHFAIDQGELISLLEEVFEVGHVFQIDYINADCHCDISLSTLDSSAETATHIEGVPQSSHAHSHSVPEKFFKHVREGTSAHSGRRNMTNWPNRVPLDQDFVAEVFVSQDHPILIKRADSDIFPSSYAEVYHPVISDGRPAYMLRVLVDLEEQAAGNLRIALVAMGLAVFLVVIATAIPMTQYLKALKQKQRIDKRARFLANHDVLTNLNNRNNFQENVADILWKTVENEQVAHLFMFDLNDFKKMNDLHGHQLGDKILIEFADLLKAHTPPGGYVARLGGDEFVVIVSVDPNDVDDPREILNLPPQVNLPAGDDHPEISVAISGGVACYPHDAQTAPCLIQMADLALYSAKSESCDEIKIYRPEIKDEFYGKLLLLEQFGEAIEQDQIRVFYQPLVNISSGQVVGLEALARWDHPERGILAPGAFFHIFDDPDLSERLGRRVLDILLEDMARWKQSKVPFVKVNFNVVAGDLRNPNFAENVLNALAHRGLTPPELCVEVTENCLFGASKSLFTKHLMALRKAGCEIALDDFGTGYSSITQLKELPTSIVKIDKSFVENILYSNADRTIIMALLDIGKTMDFQIVLEGVELADQVRLLREMGFEIAQGYFYSRPVPFGEVAILIEEINKSGFRDQQDLLAG